MLKKKLGIEAIERNWPALIKNKSVQTYFKVPSILIISGSCENIGDSAFCDCDGLRKVVIPEGVVKIGGLAFYKCENLEKVEIPKSIEKIGYASFSGCKNATIILKKHKKDFKSIFNNSFADCKVVKKIKEGAGIL